MNVAVSLMLMARYLKLARILIEFRLALNNKLP